MNVIDNRSGGYDEFGLGEDGAGALVRRIRFKICYHAFLDQTCLEGVGDSLGGTVQPRRSAHRRAVASLRRILRQWMRAGSDPRVLILRYFGRDKLRGAGGECCSMWVLAVFIHSPKNFPKDFNGRTLIDMSNGLDGALIGPTSQTCSCD